MSQKRKPSLLVPWQMKQGASSSTSFPSLYLKGNGVWFKVFSVMSVQSPDHDFAVWSYSPSMRTMIFTDIVRWVGHGKKHDVYSYTVQSACEVEH